MLSDEKWLEKWRSLGVRYGYPTCCIESFMERRHFYIPEEEKEGPWSGTGYVPCSDCKKLCRVDFRKFVSEKITPNRICQIPFPQDETSRVTWEQIEQWQRVNGIS